MVINTKRKRKSFYFMEIFIGVIKFIRELKFEACYRCYSPGIAAMVKLVRCVRV